VGDEAMIILTRVLKLADEDGDIAVPIRIHLPVDMEDHWKCEYEIGWPVNPRRSKACGIDSVQALLIALQTVGVELYTSEAHQSGKLRWDRPGGGYGFPLAAGLRDLYEGDDMSF
jgi:hypothetical protein